MLRRLSLRLQLFTIAAVLLVAAGIISAFLYDARARRQLEDDLRAEVLHSAYVARALVEELDLPLEGTTYDPICDRVAVSADVRMTVIAADGQLLGDSRLDGEALAGAENHADRPEVQQALAEGVGFSERHSDTVHRELLYMAVPFETTYGRGVVRLAVPVDRVKAEIRTQRAAVWNAALIGLVLALVLSFLLAHLLTRRFSEVASRALRLAEGKPVKAADEPRHANTLDRIQGEINELMGEVARQRDRLGSILHTMVEGVVAIGPTGNVEVMNAAAADFFDEEDIVGREFEEVSPSPRLVELLEDLEAEEVVKVEVVLEGQTDRYVRAYARAGKQGDTVLVLQDVTSLRRLERMRTDFVSNVSHELRTPTAVIRANAEMLSDGAIHTDAGPRFLGAILRNADRLSRLISDLLALSSIESGQRAFEPAEVELLEAIEVVVDDLLNSHASEERALDITVSVDSTTYLWVDAGALDQVLVNLCENAIKYAGDTPIEVRLGEGSNGRVRVEVVDQGPGIPAAHQARIFERFYRVDKGRSRNVGGTGLGLSIVKHLVAQMNGRVGIDDNAPSGCIFWFELPASKAGVHA